MPTRRTQKETRAAGSSAAAMNEVTTRNPSGWWDGYTTEELHRLLYFHWVDPIGVAFIGLLLYVGVESLGPARSPAPPGGFSGSASNTSIWMAAGLMFAALFPLGFNIYKLPLSPKALDPQSWAVMTYPGRFAYLTRWLITLQLMYFAASLHAEHHGGWERHAVYAAATPVAAFATFVTIQFYILVASTEHYKEVCGRWAPRHYDIAFIGHVVHGPALFLALIDLFVVKDAQLLRESRPSVFNLICMVSGFALVYVSSMVVNYRLVGFWPYSIMNSLTTPIKFGKFAVAQVVILNVFLAVIYTTQYFVEQWTGLLEENKS